MPDVIGAFEKRLLADIASKIEEWSRCRQELSRWEEEHLLVENPSRERLAEHKTMVERLIFLVLPYLSGKGARLSANLRRRQPYFCDMIGEVGIDPRCARAHLFCTLFCAFALDQAERWAGHRLPKFSRVTFQETVRLVAQRQEARIGKRACGFRQRVRRHILTATEFDHDDANWLGTTISAFLVVIEKALAHGGKYRPPNATLTKVKDLCAGSAKLTVWQTL